MVFAAIWLAAIRELDTCKPLHLALANNDGKFEPYHTAVADEAVLEVHGHFLIAANRTFQFILCCHNNYNYSGVVYKL